MVCLEKAVLETNLATISSYTSDKYDHSNANYRFSAYKQYISWIYIWSFGEARKASYPIVIVWTIQKKYPSANGKYVPFNHSEEYQEEENSDEEEEL